MALAPKVVHAPDHDDDARPVEVGTVLALAKAEINQQIATAKAYPRNISAFVKDAESLVTMSEEVAGECIYTLPREGKTIVGASVRFAEIMASTWGNCRSGARVIDEDDRFVTAQGYFFDLERNSAVGFEIKRRITDRNGRRYSDDMIAVTSNAACSIAYRKSVLQGVPKVFWLQAYHAALKTIEGSQQTLQAKRTAALDYLKSKFGVPAERVFKKLDVRGVDDLTLEHIAVLKGLATTLKEGEATVEDLFGGAGEAPASAPIAPTAPAPTTPTPPPAPIYDWRAKVTDHARAILQVKRLSREKFAEFVWSVLRGLGQQQPVSMDAIAPSDWQKIGEYLAEKYGEDGRPRSSGAMASTGAAEADSTPTAPPAGLVEVEVAEVFEPEAVAAAAPDDHWTRALESGDADALIAGAQEAQSRLLKRGIKAVVVSEIPPGTGNWYVVMAPALRAAGCTRKRADGEEIADPACIKSAERPDLVAPQNVRVMLARAIRSFLDDAEGAR